MNLRALLLSTVVLFAATSTAYSDLLTLHIDVLQNTVNIGGTVDWQLFAIVSEPSVNNFGIETISVNLQDNFNEVLNPGTVGAAGTPFENYSVKFPGAVEPVTNRLLEVGAVLVQQGPAAAADTTAGDSLGPLLLATGSYTVTTPGLHTLTPTAGSVNQYFTAAGQLAGLGTAFDLAFESDSFTAIPEPSAALVGVLVAGGMALLRRRKRRLESGVLQPTPSDSAKA